MIICNAAFIKAFLHISSQLIADELGAGIGSMEQGMRNLRQLKYQLEEKSTGEHRNRNLNPERYDAFVELKEAVDELVDTVDKTQRNMEAVWNAGVKPTEDDAFDWKEIEDEEVKADVFDEARRGIVKTTKQIKKLDSALQKMKAADKDFVSDTASSNKYMSTFLVHYKKDYEPYDQGEELQNAAFDKKYSKLIPMEAEQKKKAAEPKVYEPDNRTLVGRQEIARSQGLDAYDMNVANKLRPDYGAAIDNPVHDKLLESLKKQKKLLEKEVGFFDLYGKLHGNTQEYTDMKTKLDQTIQELENNPYYIYQENGKQALAETFSSAQVYYSKKYDGAGKDAEKAGWKPSSDMGQNRLNGSCGIMSAIEEVLPRETLADISFKNAQNRVNEKLQKAINNNKAADIRKYTAEAIAARAIKEHMALREKYKDIKVCDLFSPESIREMGISAQQTEAFKDYTRDVNTGYLGDVQQGRTMGISGQIFDGIMKNKQNAIKNDIVIKRSSTVNKEVIKKRDSFNKK